MDYFWHTTLPVMAVTISSFATLTLLTKNSFLDEINKQYVMTARAKGLAERRVLYGHVFRNAMLIVIAGFPAMFLGVFFGSSILIETIFSLDGLGRLGFEAAVQRDYPVIFGTLYVFGLMGLVVGILSDLMYVFVDPRIDFEKRARLMADVATLNRRRWRNFRRNRRAFWSMVIFSILFVLAMFAEIVANDKPIVVRFQGELYWPAYNFYPETAFGGDFGTEAVYRDAEVQCLIVVGRPRGLLGRPRGVHGRRPGRRQRRAAGRAGLDDLAADPLSAIARSTTCRHRALARPTANTCWARTTPRGTCWRG